MKTRLAIIPLLAVAAAGIAGCGGSSKAAGIETAPSGGATEASVPATPKPPPALANKPVVTVPTGPAPTKLVTKDLVQGTGQTVKPGWVAPASLGRGTVPDVSRCCIDTVEAPAASCALDRA